MLLITFTTHVGKARWPGRRLTYGVAVAGRVPDWRLPYGKYYPA